MPFGDWLNEVESVMREIEARYGMRIDWGYYEGANYDWQASWRIGFSPAGAVSYMMERSGKLGQGVDRFRVEIAALVGTSPQKA